jgi:trigger factor
MSDEEMTADQEEVLEEPEEDLEELDEDEKLMAKLKESITVEKEEIGSLRSKLTITVPRETLDERLGKEFGDLKRDAIVPGFRKGRAPMVLVQKRFGTEVGDQLVAQMVGRGYEAAIEKEDLKVIGEPLIWCKLKEEREQQGGGSRTVEVDKLLPFGEAIDHIKLPKEGALTFTTEVDIKPEFELPEVTKIPVKRPAQKITAKDVDRELKTMRSFHGTFQPVEKGGVKADDLMYADMKMTVDGEVIAREENFDIPARDTWVKGVTLKGFADASVGKKVGDTITFEATVPEEQENIDIRGKTAVFTFNILEIKRLEVPPVDEEFLSRLGFDSEKELREALKSDMEARLEQEISANMRDQIAQHLLDDTEMELPEAVSQRSTERALARRMIEMYRRNVPPSEVEKSLDKMRAEAREGVNRQLKLLFILDKVADERDIAVSEEELNGAIAAIAQRQGRRFDRVRDELSKGEGMMNLYLQIRDEKVLSALLEDAEISEAKTPKKTAKKSTKKTSKKKSTEKT